MYSWCNYGKMPENLADIGKVKICGDDVLVTGGK